MRLSYFARGILRQAKIRSGLGVFGLKKKNPSRVPFGKGAEGSELDSVEEESTWEKVTGKLKGSGLIVPPPKEE